MDNPWSNAWGQPESTPEKPCTWPFSSDSEHEQETDIGVPSWSPSEWSSSAHDHDSHWLSFAGEDRAWGPSSHEQTVLSSTDAGKTELTLEEKENNPVPATFSFHETNNDVSTLEASQQYSETHSHEADAIASGSLKNSTERLSDHGEEDGPDAWGDPTILAAPDDEWISAWDTMQVSGEEQGQSSPPDEWQLAWQQKQKFDRAVPSEMLASILRQCQEASDANWLGLATVGSDGSENNWRESGSVENIMKLIDQLAPDSSMLPSRLQFPTTVISKSMNEALRSTKHLTLFKNSPMAKVFSSKGSFDWQKSTVSGGDSVPDVAPPGWRVLKKEEQRSTAEEVKAKKAAGGLLSFWNRRTSHPPAQPEASSQCPVTGTPSTSNVLTPPIHPQAELMKQSSLTAPTPSTQPSTPVATAEAPPAPSTVSKFLNRFSRAKSSGSRHSTLALSADDLEFLSDIVPSAGDEHESGLRTPATVIGPPPFPAKLPHPLLPPPPPPLHCEMSSLACSTVDKSPCASAEHHPELFFESSQSSDRLPLAHPPISPSSNLPLSFLPSHTGSARISGKQSLYRITEAPPISSTRSNIPKLPSPPRLICMSKPSFTLPPPTKVTVSPLSLSSIPSPVSPLQTPRPSGAQFLLPPLPSTASPSPSDEHDASARIMQNSHVHDDDDLLEESFASFSVLPRDAVDTSFDSTSSTQSLGSHDSTKRLRSTRSFSVSFDPLSDFSSPHTEDGIRTPSPPPVPLKSPPANRLAMDLTSRSQVRSSDHQRTQSLMDKCNAIKGTWPSVPGDAAQARPVSVQPILRAPVTEQSTKVLALSSFSIQKGGSTLLSDNSTSSRSKEGIQESDIKSSPPLLPPPQQLPMSVPFTMASSSVLPPPSDLQQSAWKRTSLTQSGGLSAQDLSFFEGL